MKLLKAKADWRGRQRLTKACNLLKKKQEGATGRKVENEESQSKMPSWNTDI